MQEMYNRKKALGSKKKKWISTNEVGEVMKKTLRAISLFAFLSIGCLALHADEEDEDDFYQLMRELTQDNIPAEETEFTQEEWEFKRSCEECGISLSLE